ncbi:MAG TPA: RNB domain-containing ribonuclease [Candidatus Avidesulfovibrio excrementigallinarum]|nr:RNB domain-containing ribonuclease [Candidatus Avidesulfovibrio excrementigallinarum]
MSKGLVTHPGTGCVVEFMQGNAPQIAWVLEEQGGRLRLLLPNRRETNLQSSRLLPWSGPQYAVSSRDAMIKTLQEHAARRTDLAAGLNPVEWWDFAHEELSKAGAGWFAELTGNELDADLIAACGHALLACKTHFKFQPPEFELYSAEMVQRRLDEQAREAEQERLLRQGNALAKALWDTFLKHGAPPSPEALGKLDPDVLDTFRTLLRTRMAATDPDDDAFWRQLTRGLPDDPHLELHLAQAWGLVGPHHNIWLDRAGYAEGDSWSADHAGELAALAAVVTDDAPCDVPFLSIDSATTRDIDDAFHIDLRPEGGWRLTLALACPAHDWPFDSPLDKAVRARATSLYLPEGVSHMLPEALGAGHYSLFCDKARPALLIACDIAPDGAILDCTPSVGSVRLRANLTYADCEAALDGAETPASPFLDQLRMGHELALARQACRLRQGAVIIERPELVITLEGDLADPGLRVHLEPEPPLPKAHLLVAEQMIAANAALAHWAVTRDIPLLFRTQDLNVPKEVEGLWSDPLDVAKVVRFLAPAVMEPSPRPHKGVGEPCYAPVTSPLRRYPDLVNEAQVLHVLRHGAPRWDKAGLASMLVYLNSRLDAAGQVQRQRTRYWKLVYLRQQGDIWRPGLITDENDAFLTVNVPREQLILRGRRDMFPPQARLGMPVAVRIGRINPLLGDMTLLEVRPADNTNPGTDSGSPLC